MLIEMLINHLLSSQDIYSNTIPYELNSNNGAVLSTIYIDMGLSTGYLLFTLIIKLKYIIKIIIKVIQ